MIFASGFGVSLITNEWRYIYFSLVDRVCRIPVVGRSKLEVHVDRNVQVLSGNQSEVPSQFLCLLRRLIFHSIES